MNVKSEKRENDLFLYVTVLGIAVNFVVNIIAITGLKLVENTIVIDVFAISGMLGLFALFITMERITAIRKNSDRGVMKEVGEHGRKMLVLNAVFLAYYVIVSRLGLGGDVGCVSSFRMIFYSLPLGLITANAKIIESQFSRKVEWKKACGTYEEDEYNECLNALLWRLKLPFSSMDSSVSRSDIFWASKGGFLFMSFFVLAVLVMKNSGKIFVAMILFGYALLFVEWLFKLVASLDGECTGFYKKSGGKGRVYYVYIVTNYEQKREIKFRLNRKLPISEGDIVNVKYTIFTKCIIRCVPLIGFSKGRI